MYSKTQMESAFQLGYGAALARIQAGMSHEEALTKMKRHMDTALEPLFDTDSALADDDRVEAIV